MFHSMYTCLPGKPPVIVNVPSIKLKKSDKWYRAKIALAQILINITQWALPSSREQSLHVLCIFSWELGCWPDSHPRQALCSSEYCHNVSQPSLGCHSHPALEVEGESKVTKLVTHRGTWKLPSIYICLVHLIWYLLSCGSHSSGTIHSIFVW